MYIVCSPSDLDADFEDNQDYDSTVSQSETKLPMFIQSSRVDSVQEVESPTSAESMSAMRTGVSDPAELQRVTSIIVQTFLKIIVIIASLFRTFLPIPHAVGRCGTKTAIIYCS